jgi:chemotaxis response regulator CheB
MIAKKKTEVKPKNPKSTFPIVGIGASAGGLEALELG